MHDKANMIVNTAKGLVGIRYRHQGRNSKGLDCVGLLIRIAKLCGISDFDTSSYSMRPNATEFTKEMIRANYKQLPINELAHGDVLRISSLGWPVHVGVYEIDPKGNGWYIHSYLPHKMVSRDPVSDKVWADISSVWRFPESIK